MITMHQEEGYKGWFTRDQSEGAIPNGTRIIKVYSEDGDAHPNGSLGTVLGSIKSDQEIAGILITHFYFIEWDALPGTAVGTVSIKIARAHNA